MMKIEFETAELNYIMALLNEQPYKTVASLIQKIGAQIQQQNMARAVQGAVDKPNIE
jgi:hypothetical protein